MRVSNDGSERGIGNSAAEVPVVILQGDGRTWFVRAAGFRGNLPQPPAATRRALSIRLRKLVGTSIMDNIHGEKVRLSDA
jgi:hypothetical protein